MKAKASICFKIPLNPPVLICATTRPTITQFSKFSPPITIASYFSLSEIRVIAFVIGFFQSFDEYVAVVVYEVYVIPLAFIVLIKRSSLLAIVGSRKNKLPISDD